jgi:hypothetical protein
MIVKLGNECLYTNKDSKWRSVTYYHIVLSNGRVLRIAVRST